jgi:hypothetical protein
MQRTFEFVNANGIELSLAIDLRKRIGLLRCDDFGSVVIRRGRI